MPFLSELLGSDGSEVEYIDLVSNNPLIEPLDGPTIVKQLMEGRFNEEIYQQGPDTHLYKFLMALCGDSGAGLIKRQAYLARLKYESFLLVYREIDSFYVQHFRFPRLANEIYTFDPGVDILTKAQWDEIAAKDEHYKRRIIDFFHGIRLGTSPEGMGLIAKGASGIECDVIENYVYKIDSGFVTGIERLGVDNVGLTNSPNEFIIIPRYSDSLVTAVDADPSDQDVAYKTSINDDQYLNPDLEHNITVMIDRLRPQHAWASVDTGVRPYTPIENVSVFASSEKFTMARFVTGSSDIPWPETNDQGSFIVADEEREAKMLPQSHRDFPIIWQTVQGMVAYEEGALKDSTYNQPAAEGSDQTPPFFAPTDTKPAPFLSYKSEHRGKFFRIVSSIYTFLQSVPSDDVFSTEKALSLQDTPLYLEGRVK